MEPREVKDRILENISLSVKKVSAACPPRPGPRGQPGPPCPGPRPHPAPPSSPGSLARAGVPPVTGARDTALTLRDPEDEEPPGAPGFWRGSPAAHVSAAASELFLKNKVEVSILGANTSQAREP